MQKARKRAMTEMEQEDTERGFIESFYLGCDSGHIMCQNLQTGTF